MKIAFHHGKPATKEAIVALEQAIEHDISPTFLRFVEENDGAKPESNVFKVGEDNGCGVNEFIPVSQIPEEIKIIEDLPRHVYPVAWAECGNYVIIDEGREGAVFFYDHEILDGLTMLASNFEEFLMKLDPFDPKSVELRPEDIISVWISPEFQKIKDKMKKTE